MEEETKKLEIEMKLESYARMELEIAEHKAKLQSQEILANHTQLLVSQGLLKQDENGNWIPVETFEEKQRILAQKEAD